jgi:hypothetical protein
MKYYRFGRPRKPVYYMYDPTSKKKSDYMINTGRSKMLESGSFENKVWGAIHKAWKGYTIAKNKYEYDKLEHYARIIQECQHDLGLPISSFDDIGMSADDFLSKIAEKENNDDSNQVEQEVSYEQEYQTDQQYEQDRLTDYNAYSENLRDDFHS